MNPIIWVSDEECHEWWRLEYKSSVYHVNGVWFYKDRVITRSNGPAWIEGNDEYWFKNGVIHRMDGPAEVRSNGTIIYWWINGQTYSYSKFLQQQTDEDKIALILKYGGLV